MKLENPEDIQKTIDSLHAKMRSNRALMESTEYKLLEKELDRRFSKIPGLLEWHHQASGLTCLPCEIEEKKHTDSYPFLGCDRCWEFECVAGEIYDEVFKKFWSKNGRP